MTNEEIHMHIGRISAKIDDLHNDHIGLQKNVHDMRDSWREDMKALQVKVDENTEHMKLQKATIVLFKWLIGIGVAIFGAKLAGIWSTK